MAHNYYGLRKSADRRQSKSSDDAVTPTRQRQVAFSPMNRLRTSAKVLTFTAVSAFTIQTLYSESIFKKSGKLEKSYLKRAEVALHDNIEKRIWVTFQNGVYDVTDFVGIHPVSCF